MKKKIFNFVFVLALLLPLSTLLSACVGDVRYIGVLPNVYEADLHVENDNSVYIYDYSSIKRTESIQGQDYLVWYGKYHCKNKNTLSEVEEEWLCIWNETEGNWDFYEWDNNHWGLRTNAIDLFNIKDTFKAVRETATYMTGVKIKKSDLLNETNEYLEYKWGGKYPDKLKVSNNIYHVCLKHEYNDKNGTYATEEFTKFIFDESTTPIPHIEHFSFGA